MPGPVALVGAGEFTPAMAEVDRALLAATGIARPRVVVVPTASWPDGETVFHRWGAMGQAHFEALGAEVEQILVRDRAEADDPACAQAAGEADLVYFSGGKPDHLREVLDGSALWAAVRSAHDRGAVLAGCSAGAMILGGKQVEFRRRVALPVHWVTALGVLPGIAVIPHYDRFPETLSAVFALRAPKGIAVLGIDEDTAVVERDGVYEVQGRAGVTIWRGRAHRRVQVGETFSV
jgi:cyanophycinase